VDRTGSGSCPVAGFGISGVGLLFSAARVSSVSVIYISLTPVSTYLYLVCSRMQVIFVPLSWTYQ
jgi:uncharacterized membrane protein